jgi:glyoxylase-like metal-dependent hydrolase (beta-lactamase superfamily II)
MSNIYTLDLHFQGRAQAIAAYLVPHADGVVLIEAGPGSTKSALIAALAEHGYEPRHVTHALLTHIHLDHAGAAGWLAGQGAQIVVHPIGAPHMLNPEKLLASATRIYAERMDSLWGEFLPVPQDKLHIAQDGEEITVGALKFVAVNTPGHAEHHYAYLFDDVCFSGDVGAVRIPGYPYLRVPMPPPELHLEKWRASVARLQSLGFKRIAPTHFGMFDDVDWHLAEIVRALDAAERWLEETMPADPPLDTLREAFTNWMDAQGDALGMDEQARAAYSLANPLGMSADGLQRYWRKFRMA